MDQPTTPTPPQEQTEREAFEAWALRNGYSTFTTPGAVGPDGLMVYHDARTHAAWWAWQARASMQAQAPEVSALQRELEELRANAERYEVVRTLNPRQFADLWERNINGGPQFDALVDELASKAEVAKDGPVPVGLICERVALRRLLDDVDSLPLHAHKRKVVREWIESAMASIKAEVPNV